MTMDGKEIETGRMPGRRRGGCWEIGQGATERAKPMDASNAIGFENHQSEYTGSKNESEA